MFSVAQEEIISFLSFRRRNYPRRTWILLKVSSQSSVEAFTNCYHGLKGAEPRLHESRRPRARQKDSQRGLFGSELSTNESSTPYHEALKELSLKCHQDFCPPIAPLIASFCSWPSLLYSKNTSTKCRSLFHPYLYQLNLCNQ